MERLEQTGRSYVINGEVVKARKKTTNKWFETQDNIGYWEDFDKPKIMWKRIGSIIRFCHNENGAFGLDSTCFAAGNDIEYICCVLNSPMGHYLLKDSPRTGTGDLLISVQAIEPLKIPRISKDQSLWFKSQLVNICHIVKEEQEDEINQKIFDLHDLSSEEREYILTHFHP